MIAKLIATPASSLIDEKNVISLTGLDKHQNVTLYAQLRSNDSTLFHSSAHYIADESGCVVLNEQPSLGGSYTGLHPMGLLWSLELGLDEKKGYRLTKKDATTPYEVRLQAFRGHLTKEECKVTSLVVENVLCECQFLKWYMTPDVRRIPVREGRIRGTLFLPPGAGPFPGLINMLGLAGGLLEYKAALFASHGFATLELVYFNYDDLPPAVNKLDVEYFEEALEWMCGHPKVQRGGVGVHGVSKGGEIALLLASLRPEVSAVSALAVPHGVSYFGLSHRGKVGECIDVDTDKLSYNEDSKVYCFRDCYNNFSEEVGTPVENIKGEILLVLGEDDQSFNAVGHKDRIVERCAKHGKNIRVLSYPGAGHLIEPPYTPLCSKSYQGTIKIYVLWGGQLVEHAHAQEDYWSQVIKFFKSNVPRKSKL